MFPRVTHPSATPYCYSVRLACVRPAASVRSEPGSNSQVKSRIQCRLVTTLFRRVPSTPASSFSAQNTMNLFRDRQSSLYVHPLSEMNRKDPADHVSLSSDSIVKQHSPKQQKQKLPNPKTPNHPASQPGQPKPDKIRKSVSRQPLISAAPSMNAL